MVFNLLKKASAQAYHVKDAGKSGKGMFASRDIKVGETFLTCQAETITDEDWDLIEQTRLPAMYGFNLNGKHAALLGSEQPGWMTAEEKRLVSKTIVSGGLHPFMFVNHGGKDSNAEEVFSGSTVSMRAIRPIKKGEEITKEYSEKGVSRISENRSITDPD